MALDITPRDLEVISKRFKAAIRGVKSNAGKMEKSLGISKGSLTKLYKGKYPLRENLLTSFAEEVGAEPVDLVTGTVFAVLYGYEEPAPPPEPDETPTDIDEEDLGPPEDADEPAETLLDEYPSYPGPGLRPEGAPIHMDVPLHEQQTLTDEHHDVDADLKATEMGSHDRVTGPWSSQDEEGFLLDEDASDEIEEHAYAVEDAVDHDGPEDADTLDATPEELIESVRKKQSQPPEEHPAKPKPDDKGLWSKFKGLFG